MEFRSTSRAHMDGYFGVVEGTEAEFSRTLSLTSNKKRMRRREKGGRAEKSTVEVDERKSSRLAATGQ